MVETSLVYITGYDRRRCSSDAVSCDGRCIATCRHVWRAATAEFRDDADGQPTAEVEFPQSWRDGTRVRCGVSLADPCRAGPDGPEPDLVLLQPDSIPDGAVRLTPSSTERYETGDGYAYAGLPGRDPSNPSLVQEVNIPGVIASTLRSDRRRQFTGANTQGYWTDRGSSGSPVFLEKGEQLAGIISLSETGRKSGESPIHEAFVVPGTIIRRYLETFAAVRRVAEREQVPAARLQPILDVIGAGEMPPDQMAERLHQFFTAARARGEEQVRPSNEGADIDLVIGAAREKIGTLDVAGARGVLQAKIEEEEVVRRARMLPLLKERAAIERLAFDHGAAKTSLGEITRLAPDDVWAWIDLGDEWRTTGPLDRALASFRRHWRRRSAAATSATCRSATTSSAMCWWRRATCRARWRPIASASRSASRWRRAIRATPSGSATCRSATTSSAMCWWRRATCWARWRPIARASRSWSTLAARDPGNTQWQRDLSVSHSKLGDVLVAQGDLPGALEAYRKGLAIMETLAARDPGNTEWQRDLSVSHNKLGDVLVAQGDLAGALEAYRKGLAIRERLAARDPGNTQWQRDLSVSHNKLGDVLVAQGDLPGALEAYRKGLAIRETLAARDPGNARVAARPVDQPRKSCRRPDKATKIQRSSPDSGTRPGAGPRRHGPLSGRSADRAGFALLRGSGAQRRRNAIRRNERRAGPWPTCRSVPKN